MVPIAPMGIFGSVYNASGDMVALAYLIGMVALVFTAASYAQMVRAFPAPSRRSNKSSTHQHGRSAGR
jgi:hypothetical protein